MYNPNAKILAQQFCESVSCLLKLSLKEDREGYTKRVKEAGRAVFFSNDSNDNNNKPLLLPTAVLDEFALGDDKSEMVMNSHISILAMVDCWAQLGINPYHHFICETPLYRLRLGK